MEKTKNRIVDWLIVAFALELIAWRGLMLLTCEIRSICGLVAIEGRLLADQFWRTNERID